MWTEVQRVSDKQWILINLNQCLAYSAEVDGQWRLSFPDGSDLLITSPAYRTLKGALAKSGELL